MRMRHENSSLEVLSPELLIQVLLDLSTKRSPLLRHPSLAEMLSSELLQPLLMPTLLCLI